jgi:hypothetical protein
MKISVSLLIFLFGLVSSVSAQEAMVSIGGKGLSRREQVQRHSH